MDETQMDFIRSNELRLDRARNELLEILSEISLSHQEIEVWGHLVRMGDTVVLETFARTLNAARG